MSSTSHTESGATQQVTLPPEPLRAFTAGVLEAVGTPPDIADEVSRHLVGANLAGHDSHGVQRLPWYVESALRGTLDVQARPEIVEQRQACALFDANRGFGHYAAKVAINWALDHAPDYGLASAAIRRSGHIGRLGEYSETAVARGFLAIVTVGNAGPSARWTPPFGGQAHFLGTNPWSLGAPAGPRPYVYDAATTTVAEGKVQLARARGAELKPDCVIDKEGRPTSNPEDLYDGGSMVPLGAQVAGHKGFGLGLGSALFGALSQAAARPQDGEQSDLGGVWMLAVDPSAFGDPGVYRARAEHNLAALKGVPPAPGFSEVLVPGEPEAQSRRQRSAGIPIPAATFNALSELADRFDVPGPAPQER
ncbi:MAG: Ldh family oxidoreductase [Candidatus Dormibacteraeota bacterium]|nr:Ldh family oxidoreductase [Candidatus Dormibacteraeota bacterium]